MSAPNLKRPKPSPTLVSAPSPVADAAPQPAEPPQPPAAESSDAQWPSQCEDMTGITYRYRKGITEAWSRERLARVTRPRSKPAAGA